MRAKLSVDITQQEKVGFPTDFFFPLSQSVLSEVRPDLLESDRSLSLVFLDDKAIQDLNKQYRGKDKPTDVLSFSYIDDASSESLGELVISVETMEKQAEEHGHSSEQEAKILFVHGLLHILGYDHETPSDLKQMLALEKKFLGDKAGLIERSQSG